MISYDICLSLSEFCKYNVLSFHSCCYKWHYFIIFCGWVICYICTRSSLSSLSVDRYLGCFHVLVIANSTLLTLVCMYLSELEFCVFWIYAQKKSSRIAGSYGNSIFIFQRISILFVLHSDCTNLYSHQQYSLYFIYLFIVCLLFIIIFIYLFYLLYYIYIIL